MLNAKNKSSLSEKEARSEPLSGRLKLKHQNNPWGALFLRMCICLISFYSVCHDLHSLYQLICILVSDSQLRDQDTDPRWKDLEQHISACMQMSQPCSQPSLCSCSFCLIRSSCPFPSHVSTAVGHWVIAEIRSLPCQCCLFVCW